METKKAEVIRKAWGELYDKVEKHLNKDGYVPFQITELKIIFFDNEELFETTDKMGFNGECIGIELFRPKSIQGIENNNGWIRIESEEDLPAENSGLYFVYDGKDVGIARMSTIMFRCLTSNEVYSDVTHFQPTVKPKKPIY